MTFEVKDTGSKGVGVFATALLTPGTLILSEKVLLRIDKSYYMQSDIETAFAALSPDQQEIYLSLSSAHGQDPKRYPRRIHPSVDAVERQRIQEQHKARTAASKSVLSVFMTNAIECGRGAAVFATASRFNHSCVPNAFFAWNDKLGVETIYATKHIACDEEITLSYCDPYCDVTMRMFELWHYGFECECPACGDSRIPGSFAALSRDRRLKLREIDEFVFLDDKEKLLAKLESAALFREEGLVHPSLGQLYLEIARICVDKEDFEFSVHAAEKALEVYMICLGPDAERTESAVKSVRAFKRNLRV